MQRRGAFTLVELMAVIGIIVVLAGLTLTGLSGARKSARSVTCLSNLRQLASAAVAYAERYDGSYPPAQWSDTADPALTRGWDYTRRGATVLMRASVEVGARRNTQPSFSAWSAVRSSCETSGGRSVSSSESMPAAFASAANRPAP